MNNEMREQLIEAINDKMNILTPFEDIAAAADAILADGWIRPKFKVGEKRYFADKVIAEYTITEIIPSYKFDNRALLRYEEYLFDESYATESEAQAALERRKRDER